MITTSEIRSEGQGAAIHYVLTAKAPTEDELRCVPLAPEMRDTLEKLMHELDAKMMQGCPKCHLGSDDRFYECRCWMRGMHSLIIEALPDDQPEEQTDD